MMPRIGPGLMMSRINRYEAAWPLETFYAQGEKHPNGEQHSQKEQYGQKKQHTDYPPGRGGGLFYLILKRFACVNKYIIETQ